MNKNVGIYEAKTHFSKLINDVQNGQEIVIERSGEAVAKIVPIALKKKNRIFGSALGEVHLKSSFYDPLPAEELDGFGL